MKEKGFTLTEMLIVLVIVSVLLMILLPNIITQLEKNRDEVSDLSLQMMYSAMDLYLNDYSNKYEMKEGNVYCVTLEELVSTEHLTAPVVDIKTGMEIPLTTVIKTSVVGGKYVYEFDSTNCKQ